MRTEDVILNDSRFPALGSNIPSTLYKFYSLSDESTDQQSAINESKLATFENQELWMATHESLNDPFEIAAFYIDYGKGYPTEFCDKLAGMLEECKKDVRIASLSSNDYSSMLMWAYYANSHKGFCVEFAVGEQHQIWQVFYTKKRYGLINAFVRYMFNEMGVSEKKDFEQMVSILSKAKGEEWKNEKEYRVILPSESVRQVSESGGVVSFQSVGLYPKRIFLGLNCSEKHRKRLEKIGISLQCPVIPLELSETDYKMVVKDDGTSKI